MEADGAIVTPFGKYKGKALAELPSDYLKWVLAKSDHADAALASAIEDELVLRGEDF